MKGREEGKGMRKGRGKKGREEKEVREGKRGGKGEKKGKEEGRKNKIKLQNERVGKEIKLVATLYTPGFKCRIVEVVCRGGVAPQKNPLRHS